MNPEQEHPTSEAVADEEIEDLEASDAESQSVAGGGATKDITLTRGLTSG